MQCPHCGKTIEAEPSWGARMYDLRTAQGIGLRRLAQVIGLSPRYIRDIEKGMRNKPEGDRGEWWEHYLTTGELPPRDAVPLKKRHKWYTDMQPTGNPPGRPRRKKKTPPDDVFLDIAAGIIKEV